MNNIEKKSAIFFIIGAILTPIFWALAWGVFALREVEVYDYFVPWWFIKSTLTVLGHVFVICTGLGVFVMFVSVIVAALNRISP